MPSPAEQVDSVFAQAKTLANIAQTQAASFLNALNTSVYTPPTISVSWTSLSAPTLPSLPSAPALPDITFAIPAGAPADFVTPAPNFTISDFVIADPTLNMPTTPSVSYGAIPVVPGISDVAVPVAPTIIAPSLPTYLSLNTVAFGGIDVHADWLAKLENIPTMALMEPTPYSYALGAEYASTLLTNLKSTLDARLAGGTGLSAAVEQALWDRARGRETTIAQANIDEVMRKSEALGYVLPPGTLSAQLREAEQAYYDKLSGVSRDISIKQAEMEQENLKQTIAAGMQLEGQLIDYSYKLEQLSFETAKQYADNAIQSYNAQVESYKALLAGYQAYSDAYRTLIAAETTKLEAYKAELQGESTKAQINSSLVEQYKAQIQAGMAQVEIYKAQVGAAQTLVGLEQAKIGAAGEQIRAYVAQVNAETSKVEVYKATVQAEATKVEAYKAQAQAYGAKVGAEADKARAMITQYSAQAQAYAAQWEGYRAKVMAESERIKALGIQSGAALDGYKAASSAIATQAEMTTKVWETQIRQYEAGQTITLQASKINADNVIATNNARLDAAKVGAQIYAQMTSSAYSMMNAGASVSGTGSTSVSYNYSNSTATTAPTLVVI